MKLTHWLAVIGLIAGCGDGGTGPGTGGNGKRDMSSPPPQNDMAVNDLAQPPGNQPDMTGVPGTPDMVMPPGNQDMTGGGNVDAGPPSNCMYPPGPYKSTQGGILDPTISFLCLKPGETSGPGTMMTVKDFFDCDGTRKINAVLYDVSSTWCGPCNSEADEMEGHWSSSWEKLGIVPVTLMDQNGSSQPATIQTAIDWAKKHKLQHVYVCAAPRSKIMTGNGIPFNVAVDPRTQKVVGTGAGSIPSSLESTAKANQK